MLLYAELMPIASWLKCLGNRKVVAEAEGSMHLFMSKTYGGNAIVCGHLPHRRNGPGIQETEKRISVVFLAKELLQR
jgi:hypothetical protein